MRAMTALSSVRQKGAFANMRGRLAEDCVARLYRQRGHHVIARRWRGASGEIDLVARDQDTVIFVEVKSAITLNRAAERVMPRQLRRLILAAQEFLGSLAGSVAETIRFDLAFVDRHGQIEIVENAVFEG